MKKSCTWAVAAATGLLAMAGMANRATAQCGTYIYSTSTGTIVPGDTNTGNQCDDCTTSVALPFTWNFYGANYTTVNVDSNGCVHFGANGSVYNENSYCLPYTGWAAAAMCPAWTDGYTTPNSATLGIYTSVSGSAPNRIFNIEFRNSYFPGAGSANYEVRLYEGLTRFDFVYGTATNNYNSTVGCQNPGHTVSTQVQCTSPLPAAGTMLTFDCPAVSPPSCSLSFSPASGQAGSSFSAFAQVTPGTGPPSTGLAASLDASSVGGGTVVLHDDGVFPDVTAGDNIFSGSVTSSGSTAPATYTLTSTVSDAQARTSTCSANYTIMPPAPVNDDCAGAIPAALGANAFDSTQATTSSPAATCGALGSDLWYTFSSPTGGTLTVSACGGTTADTAIAIYSDCNTSIACNDDFCGLESTVSACTSPNQTYLLRVGGFAGTHWVGSFNVSLTSGGNPTVAGSASPTCVSPGSAVNIFAQVTNPGCPPQTATSASADASSIGGGSNVNLHDDGVPPDVAAGDGIFSGTATVSGSTGQGGYSLPITVNFPSGPQSTSASVTVTAPYTPPATSTPEGEDCNQVFPDNFNGGCNSTPVVYSNADFCTNYTATSANSTSFRDTDWWMFNLDAPDTVTVTGQSNFPAQWFFVLPTCPGTIDPLSPIVDNNCTPNMTLTATLPAGPHVFFCSPLNFNGDTVCGQNGNYWFNITLASNPTCAPTGACCQSTGCVVTTQAGCQTLGGTYNGDGSHCSSCPATGACCTPNGCSIITQAACSSAGGNYQGDGSACPQSTYQLTQGNTSIEDISSTGTMLFSSATDNGGVALNPTSGTLDDGSVSLPLPFAFSYYGVAQTQIQVATNGYMTFDSNTGECCDYNNAAGIPNTGLPNNMICPPWDDFYYFNNGHVGYQVNGVAPNRRLIIQATNTEYFGNAAAGLSTFQVILYETSNNVEIRIGNIADGEPTTDANKVLGLENADGTAAVNVPWPGNTAANGTSYMFVWTPASCGLSNCCRSDYNGDGDVGTDADIEAFFACLAGDCCPTCPPDADFNCDGDVGTDADIESFFRVLAGGPC